VAQSVNWKKRLSPTHRIVNVGWSGKAFFVEILVTATYRAGARGSRSVFTSIASKGALAGGVVLGQVTIETPLPGPAINGRMRYRGLLRFKRPLSGKEAGAAFQLSLAGAIAITDPAQPGSEVDLFCGTTTTSGSISYEARQNPVDPNQVQVIGHATVNYSSPAGGGTITTEFIAADINAADCPFTVPLLSSSTDEIWYQDQYGNYINTHRPCSEIPLPGGPPILATRIEGFDEIIVTTYPASKFKAVPQSEWEPDHSTIVEKKPGAEDDPKTHYFQSTLAHQEVGTNADFLPIIEELGNGVYTYRLETLTFTQLPRVSPKKIFSVAGDYPLTPTLKYSFRAAAGNTAYEPVPVDLLLTAGAPPPSDQAFA
jgi:hypothetical protein